MSTRIIHTTCLIFLISLPILFSSMLWISASKSYILVIIVVKKSKYASTQSLKATCFCADFFEFKSFVWSLQIILCWMCAFQILKSLNTSQMGALNLRYLYNPVVHSLSGQVRRGVGADPAKRLVKVIGSWYTQGDVFVTLQNRLPEERRRWGRGRPGTAPPSPTRKATAETRGRIFWAGDWPGGG